jgi:hypothetical protein
VVRTLCDCQVRNWNEITVEFDAVTAMYERAKRDNDEATAELAHARDDSDRAAERFRETTILVIIAAATAVCDIARHGRFRDCGTRCD